MGGLTRRAGANPHEIVSRLAERTGAEASVMPVPFMANTAGDRDVLLGQREAAAAYELARGCDLILVGIGTTVAEAELVTTGMIEPAEMAAIARAGGVGEMLGHFFDARGRPVENELTERIVTQPIDDAARAGASSPSPAARSRSTRSAPCSRAASLTGLITDERTARAIVERPRPAAGRTAARAAMAVRRHDPSLTPLPRRPVASDRVLEPAQ